MNPEQYVRPEARYETAAAEASGGASLRGGGPPYALYGVPMGQVSDVVAIPFYRRPLVCFGAGALTVGALWLYFGWWRPRSARTTKKNGRKAKAEALRKQLAELEAQEDA